jgi:uncharacterized protein (TIGR00299 family) protein
MRRSFRERVDGGSGVRRILYLEPIGGIAGDMFLAAALDLGVSPEELRSALSGLSVPGWKLSLSRAERHAIQGSHVDVVVDEAVSSAHPHRSLREIEALIRGAGSMPERARERALRLFRIVGEAESKIHGVPVDQIHFHEVGAVDSIVDICGAAVVLELLGDPEVYSAPPPLGGGTVRGAHGVIPVPSPAALEILKDTPVRFEGTGELTTPTGAAILKGLARVEAPPPLRVEKVGYGVGTKDFADRPNVLRASLAEAVTTGAPLFVVEANLDDCAPQLLAEVLERTLEAGALDAHILPATMKKGRPGHLLSALVEESCRQAVIDLWLKESTTLGVRFHAVERTALERRWVEVKMPYGSVRVKVGSRQGQTLNVHPEFDDCRRLSRETGVPVKQVMFDALAAFAAKER